MKQNLIILLIVLLACNALASKTKMRSRAKLHLRSRKTDEASPNQFTNIHSLRSAWFASQHQDLSEPPSQIEKNPNGYVTLNPLSEEENNAIWPKAKYSKDQQAYYPLEATPDNIKPDDTLLVANMTAMRNFKGSDFFDNGVATRSTQPNDVPTVIYKADQKAYYNPIHEKNMVKDDLNNLISVPIDLKSKHIFVDDDNEILERRRFINKKSIYYDASRLFERPTQDPIQKALDAYEVEKVKKKSLKYKDFLKFEADKKEKVAKVLGKYEEYDPDQGQAVVNEWIRKQKIKKDMDRAEETFPKVVPPIKANEPAAYYDATQN